MEKLRIEWHRIAAFVSALALVLLWVLPFAVTPAQAASDLPVKTIKVSDHYTSYGLDNDGNLVSSMPSGAPWPYVYKNYQFILDNKNSYYLIQTGAFGLEWFYNPQVNVYRQNSTAVDFYVGSSNVTTHFTFIPSDQYYIKGQDVDGLAYQQFYDISDIVSDGFTDLKLSTSGFYQVSDSPNRAPSSEVTYTWSVTYYDSSKDKISSNTSTDSIWVHRPSVGDVSWDVSSVFAIPSNADYLACAVSFKFNSSSFSEGEHIVIGSDQSVSMRFYRSDSTLETIPPTDPTEPEPSAPSGGSGDSGGNSGSGGNVSFDDSGIINSVGNAADKVITEIGGSIDNQTSQIEAMVDGVRDDLDDLYNINSEMNDNLEDIDDNLHDVNDNLGTMIGTGDEGDVLTDQAEGLNDDISSIGSFESEQQNVLDSNFSTIQSEVDISKFAYALWYVQDVLNMTFLSLGDLRLLYSFPLFLGLFFFLCSRAPGAVHVHSVNRYRAAVRNSRSNLNHRGGAG